MALVNMFYINNINIEGLWYVSILICKQIKVCVCVCSDLALKPLPLRAQPSH